MLTSTQAHVVLVGASTKPERYAFMAATQLVNAGYAPTLVGLRAGEVAGRAIHTDLTTVKGSVDTITLYVGPSHQQELIDPILSLKPRRIVFNPGTENPEFEAKATEAGIEVIEACTLVMLRTGQF
jgi:predicted CoA-binding protein